MQEKIHNLKINLLIDRLFAYFEVDTNIALANKLGVSPTTLSNWKARNTFDWELLFTKCESANMNWLLSGVGPMLKSEEIFVCKPKNVYGEIKIPLVSVAAVGGFGNANFAIKESDVRDYYIIPKFKDRKIDFMIEIYGSSMQPKYNSSDIIACTIIKESNFIQWNKVHIISTTEQGILVKRLRKGSSPDLLLAVSDNKDYDPFEIPVNEIIGLAIVVGIVRLE